MFKLITLNTWAGRVNKILDFLKSNIDIDIYCFQEIYNGPPNYLTQGEFKANVEIYSDIAKILPNHVGYFRTQYNDNFGLAIFINEKMGPVKEEETYIYKSRGYKSDFHTADHARNLQSLSFNINGRELNIFNLHGLWNGMGKSDSEYRLEQSRRIVAYTDQFTGSKILCGDFNLLPNTKSIKIIEESGMKNLITDNGIISTRTSYYKKDIRFADYVFTNDKVEVFSFEVVEDEISDHSALKLAFELK